MAAGSKGGMMETSSVGHPMGKGAKGGLDGTMGKAQFFLNQRGVGLIDKVVTVTDESDDMPGQTRQLSDTRTELRRAISSFTESLRNLKKNRRRLWIVYIALMAAADFEKPDPKKPGRKFKFRETVGFKKAMAVLQPK